MRFPRTIRSAFSLLEMVLALALAMVLMLALYLTLSTYMTSTQTGRDVLAEGEIARSVMARLSHDITNQLGAFDTRCQPDYVAAAGDAAAQDPTMAAPTVIPNSVPIDAVGFNVGVQGSASTLRLSVYRVENPAVGNIAKTTEQQSEILCDLRRIDYWLVSSGDNVLGLARREIKMATSDDIDTDPTEIAEQEKYIIAPEVKGLTFQFYSGTEWTESWDGAAPKDLSGADGTPSGPPGAIKITMKIQRKANQILTGSATETLGPEVQYTFVVAVPASNNFTPKTSP